MKKVITEKDKEEAKEFFGLTKDLETPYDRWGRECSCCGSYKEWEEFKGHSRSKTGKSSKCKECYFKNRKAVGRKAERMSSKKRAKLLKKKDPLLWKARTLRSRLLTRGKKASRPPEETPTASELYEWFSSLEEFTCYYTGAKVDIFKCHIDHKQPLNRGGTNELSNLCITDPKVNSSKGAMNEEEFKELLELVSDWPDEGEYLLSRLRMGYFGKLK